MSGIRGCSWSALPPEIKEHAEMRFHSTILNDAPTDPGPIKKRKYGAEDAYSIYGVDPLKGAVVVVRPDGYAGAITSLGEVSTVEKYLRCWIRQR